MTVMPTPTRPPKTVAIVCAVCRQKLADAIPGSIARCPSCGVWSGTRDRPRLPRRHSPPAQPPEVAR